MAGIPGEKIEFFAAGLHGTGWPLQDITLTVVSERSVREVALEEDTDELSTVNVQSFVDEQEWRLYSNVETRVEVVTRVYQGDDCSHPSFSTLCHASRRFGFYFWNILFVMVKQSAAFYGLA